MACFAGGCWELGDNMSHCHDDWIWMVQQQDMGHKLVSVAHCFILSNICPTIDMSYFSGGAEFLPSTVFGVSRGGLRYQKLLGFEYKDIRYTKDE